MKIGTTTLLGLCCLLSTTVLAQEQGGSTAAMLLSAGRKVVITVDDLPYAGGTNSLEEARRTAERMTAALARYDAPASGFVTSTGVFVQGEVDERLDLLRLWRDAGVRLENHGFAHLAYNATPVAGYLDEVSQGHVLPDQIMRERADSVRFFRAPFNQTGPTPEAKDALLTYLHERGLRLAPFTVEHADYLFNALYTDALSRHDSASAVRIGEAYLAQLDTAFAFAERLSNETFGREIPQVFLIHANRLNSDLLDRMLLRLLSRGYTFISFDEALQDPAYASPDEFVGPWGISWLHRWRKSMGLENRLRYEPEPPAWALEAYQELSTP